MLRLRTALARPPPPPCGRSRSRPRRPAPPPAALDPNLPSLVDGLLAAGVVAGLALSAAPLVTGASARRVEAARARADAARAAGRGGAADEEEDADDVKWGVMSVVACVPLLNWTAWIFGALDDPVRAPVYLTFAGLYAAAAARHGLALDAGALAAVAACAVHVQLERAAATEVVRLSLPEGEGASARAVARAAARAAADAADVAADAAARLGASVRAGLEDEEEGEDGGDSAAPRRALPEDTRAPAPRRRRKGEDDDDGRLDAALLASFDERMAARAREKEREEGGGQQQ